MGCSCASLGFTTLSRSAFMTEGPPHTSSLLGEIPGGCSEERCASNFLASSGVLRSCTEQRPSEHSFSLNLMRQRGPRKGEETRVEGVEGEGSKELKGGCSKWVVCLQGFWSLAFWDVLHVPTFASAAARDASPLASSLAARKPRKASISAFGHTAWCTRSVWKRQIR